MFNSYVYALASYSSYEPTHQTEYHFVCLFVFRKLNKWHLLYELRLYLRQLINSYSLKWRQS